MSSINDCVELQEWAIQELIKARHYEALEELRVLLKIGKFAFVHEHIIKSYTKPAQPRAR
ncbi:MAG: hypothetical protein F6J87_10680 [Spirulina sp. SIO3F2]|nr:hypothetical protein [Spirulina sp. SIO3F2]